MRFELNAVRTGSSISRSSASIPPRLCRCCRRLVGSYQVRLRLVLDRILLLAARSQHIHHYDPHHCLRSPQQRQETVVITPNSHPHTDSPP